MQLSVPSFWQFSHAVVGTFSSASIRRILTARSKIFNSYFPILQPLRPYSDSIQGQLQVVIIIMFLIHKVLSKIVQAASV